MKNFLSSLVLMFFYTLIILVFGFFVFSIAYRVNLTNVKNYLVFGVITLFYVNLMLIIGLKQSKNVKKLELEDKKKFMIKQVNVLYVFITIAAIALVISAIYRFKNGMIMSALFIAAFAIWELGAYLGYKSLQKINN